ncbi:XRE family transcriptional regulator [Erwinia endophytica]|uniref:helix-turn-helix domain-containing protein n=1 Tax=Erwinia endophytica TaxID=1563158 RepID=UPI001265E295|nr:XRE family transcriptional regulator [Erwinia endophytica]KAB8313230.1 XRE family transcriptional regulator [Erwinia endophytica]
MTDKIETGTTHVTKADGNVFADLGFEPEEATRLLAQSNAEIARADELKKQLMQAISEWIQESGYRQLDAANILHVSRPRISDLVNQKTDKFTLDSLVGMLGSAGKTVRLQVE